MGEDSVPGDIPRIRSSLRGYDRGQVDELLEELQGAIETLTRERSALAARLGGSEDETDPGGEIDAVTSEVGSVLHAAQEASDEMRSRASEDAGRWRADADAEARAVLREGAEGAQQLRESAWKTATDLLEQARSEAAHMARSAESEALTIRAEAEREASQYVGAARKDMDEESRQARLESERSVSHARLESDRLINQANLEAEAAQKRAQALEQRRAELMAELETAQEAISQVESELETRKESLRTAGRSDTGSVRVLPMEPDEEWFDDDETVLVVRGDALSPEPIDADEFVAEVRRLRDQPEPDQDTGEEPGALEVVPDEDESEEVAAAFDPGEVSAPTVTGEQWSDADEPPDDDISSLFDQLRSTGPSNDSAGPAPSPAPGAASVATVTAPAVATDPFDIRDRLLLPLTNSALREMKRALVDLQNVTLEQVRETGEGWQPIQASFEDAFRVDLEYLAQESHVAGYAAAAELAGAPTTPRPNIDPADPTAEIAGTLWGEVDEVAAKAGASGAGARQTAAAVSRIFRTWRTDSAERWLRVAAFRAYHDGVLAGLAELGVPEVVGVADGRPCADCPASQGRAWAPGSDVPTGAGLPPVHLDCACTISLP